MTEQQPEAPAVPGVTRWRKKPVVISAIQWTGDNLDEVLEFTGCANFDVVGPEDRGDDPEITAQVFDRLHSTWVHVYDGQWIIRGVQGEFYPIAADVLAATYEPAGEPPVLPPDEFAGLKAVARTFGAVATKPCGCGPDEPCEAHADRSPSPASPEPDTAAMGPPEGTWRERAEAAEAKLAAVAAYCVGRGIAYSDTGTLQTLAGILAIIGTEEEVRDDG